MRRRVSVIFSAMFAAVVVLVWQMAVVNPVVKGYAQAIMETYTVDCVNRAMTRVIMADTYRDLTDVRWSPTGTITGINVNMAVANRIAGDVAGFSQEYLDTMTADGVPVPFGTFSGVAMFAGKGKPINLKIRPLGVVNCRFDSTFTSGGINQTRHRVQLYADTTVNIILPLSTHRLDVSIVMLFSESVIIGDVPQYIIP